MGRWVLADWCVRQVNAASVFGQFGAPGNAAYCASKAAVIGLTRTAAKENALVRVNAVSPGMCWLWSVDNGGLC